MQSSRRIRFSSMLGAGASLVLGTAGMLVSSALFAAEACTPAACAPTSPTCQQCDQVFADAAAQLKNLNPGCCAPAAPSACTSVCNPDAVFSGGCGTGCTSDGGKKGLGDPWTLQSLLPNNPCKPNQWQIGGWTAFGYSNNPDGAFTGNGVFNNDYFGGGFNNAYEWDRLNLNQQGLYVGRVADGSDGFGLGGRAELMYGVDGNEFQSFGNNPGVYDFVNGYDHGIYEWAIPQAYVEVASGNHSVKVGHFYTLLGYEVLPTGGNFFFSKQLTFYNSEPFTHTGALVASKVTDKLTLHNGWVMGMDTGFDSLNGGSAYHGGFIYNVNDCTSITDMMVFGDLGWRGNGFINSLIVTHKWTDKIQSVHQFDVLSTDLSVVVTGPGGFLNIDRPADFATDGIAHDSIGQINYLFYEVNSRVKAGIRQEWYKADSVSYHTITYGLNVKPMANLVVRPEVRHMFSTGADNTFFQPGRGDLFNQTVFGIDAVLTY
jgi:hypothetical protein